MVASGALTLNRAEGFDELAEDEQAVSRYVLEMTSVRKLMRTQSKSQLQSQSQSQVAVDVNIHQRSTEIAQIASSISELADLFRDLGNMIVEQGTVLDSVEYNVQQTAVELKAGVEELKVAQQ